VGENVMESFEFCCAGCSATQRVRVNPPQSIERAKADLAEQQYGR
jgi:hypothetical protein